MSSIARVALGMLNFQMSKLLVKRRKGGIPLESSGAFGDLAAEKELYIKKEDGPLLLVDLENVIVFWYFPNFIGGGQQVCF
jgi:hypothetical protein